MRAVRRFLAVVALGAASSAAWFGTSSLVQNVQFAHASRDIEATRQQLASVQDLSGIYRQIAKVVEPSVVKIDVKKTIRGVRGINMPDNMLRQMFPDRDGDGEPDLPEQEYLQMGEGSGVIMEADGGTAFILTNYHVAGDASDMRVTLADGRIVNDGKLVGGDPKSDLAVIKISAQRVVPAHWGNSDELEKGDLIFAFGSPFGYVGSMTHGIVSALNRQARIIDGPFSYENFIQVDAPINPGNSGGPLVNLRGEVVGINTAIASRNGVFNGVGFAIPSGMARPVYEQLKEHGKVTRSWLGVTIADVSAYPEQAKSLGYEGDRGVIVSSIMPNAPASGKLRTGDIITSIDGKPIETVAQLRNMVAATPPGTDLKLSVVRASKEREMTLKVVEQPQDLLSLAKAQSAQSAESARKRETRLLTEELGAELSAPSAVLLEKFGLSNAASTKGALVTEVTPDSPAAAAGLHPGDLITQIGGRKVSSVAEAAAALANQDLSEGATLTITSKAGQRTVMVKAK